MTDFLRRALLTFLLGAALVPAARAGDDAQDWPSYNRDVVGTRHNAGDRKSVV